jgi:hypothetical protein
MRIQNTNVLELHQLTHLQGRQACPTATCGTAASSSAASSTANILATHAITDALYRVLLNDV